MKQLTTSHLRIAQYALSTLVVALLSPFILHGRIAPLSMKHAVGVGTGTTGTYTVKLSDYPALASVGGSVRLSSTDQLALNPDHLAHRTASKAYPIALTRVARTGRDAFSAVSTYCGPSCDGRAAEYDATMREFVCETGATFKVDGKPSVKPGIPITEGLKTFPAIYNADAGTVTLQNVSSMKVSESDEIPSKLFLDQNYPNPFNPTTMIRYGLPNGTNVKISIHSLLGNQIRVVMDGWQDAGNYTYDFSAQDLPSGVYFYRMQTDLGTLTRRMTV
jgi:hypothetical protein